VAVFGAFTSRVTTEDAMPVGSADASTAMSYAPLAVLLQGDRFNAWIDWSRVPRNRR